MQMRVALLANTRLDLLFEISQLTQVLQKRFEDDAAAVVNRSNNTVKYTHANTTGIRFPKLDSKSIRLVGYSDAGFAKNYDLS